MNNIWVPDGKTKVIVDSDGNMRIWDEIIMTKKELNPRSYGFSTQLFKNNSEESSNGRISGSDPGDLSSNLSSSA